MGHVNVSQNLDRGHARRAFGFLIVGCVAGQAADRCVARCSVQRSVGVIRGAKHVRSQLESVRNCYVRNPPVAVAQMFVLCVCVGCALCNSALCVRTRVRAHVCMCLHIINSALARGRFGGVVPAFRARAFKQKRAACVPAGRTRRRVWTEHVTRCAVRQPDPMDCNARWWWSGGVRG